MSPRLGQASRRSLLADLRAIGIAEGDVIMVHASVRSAGQIVGSVTTLVQALLDAVLAYRVVQRAISFCATPVAGEG